MVLHYWYSSLTSKDGEGAHFLFSPAGALPNAVNCIRHRPPGVGWGTYAASSDPCATWEDLRGAASTPPPKLRRYTYSRSNKVHPRYSPTCADEQVHRSRTDAGSGRPGSGRGRGRLGIQLSGRWSVLVCQ